MTTRKRWTTAVVALVALMGAAGAGRAQMSFGRREPSVTVQAAVSPKTVKRGGQATLTVTLAVREGYHINAVIPGNPDVIPATLALTPNKGITPGAPRYPASKTLTLPGMSSASQVYEGKQTITVPLTVGKTAPTGPQTVKVKFGYQACNETSCLPPDSAQVQATLTVQ